MFYQLTGMSGAGKSTIANFVSQKLRTKFKVEIIDGDEYRLNLCNDLGFSKKDRNTNVRRLGFVGRILARNGIISIMSAINPYDDIRNELNSYDCTKLVYIQCPLSVLKNRDPKGLYYRALLPEDHINHISNFTGISDPFEEPSAPDLIINTENLTIEEASNILEEFIIKNETIKS